MRNSVPGLLFSGVLLTSCVQYGSGDRCEETVQRYAIDQVTPSGMSGLKLVEQLLGVHQLRIQRVAPPEHVTVPPTMTAGSSATLTVELAPEAELSHLQYTYIPCEAGKICDGVDANCVDRFSVPVKLRLRDSGGLVDETWVGEILGMDPTDPDARRFAIVGEVDQEARSFWAFRDAGTFSGIFGVPGPNLGPHFNVWNKEVGIFARFAKGKFLGAEIGFRGEGRFAGAKRPTSFSSEHLITITAASD